jgi:rhodanese-related sulfurtransferase
MVISSVSPVEAKEILDASGDEAILLDVRTDGEYQHVHIPGSILIPVEELQKRCNELDRKKRIVVYCASGNRSQTACRILEMEGFGECINMAGGIGAWITHGLSVE